MGGSMNVNIKIVDINGDVVLKDYRNELISEVNTKSFRHSPKIYVVKSIPLLHSDELYDVKMEYLSREKRLVNVYLPLALYREDDTGCYFMVKDPIITETPLN